MCSLSASPLPTPSRKRPGSSVAVVAAAWATMPGWVRTVGQVTAVIQRMRCVACAAAPSTDQTNGLSPCASVHGWKWSDSQAERKPACSACAAAATISGAERSSEEKKIPISTMGRRYPPTAP
jgi:hypothetical protein